MRPVIRIALILVVGQSASLFAQTPATVYSISTIAGGSPPGTPSQANTTNIGHPVGVASDSQGNAYFTALNCVFRVDVNGTLTRIAGTSRPGFSGDGGPATSAQLNLGTGSLAAGLFVDAAQNVYVADQGNNRVRKISSNGTINTFAGGSAGPSTGDGGFATSAFVGSPLSITQDAAGNTYIAEAVGRIRKVNSSGIISTFAGTGVQGYSGDFGPAVSAQLSVPSGLTFDTSGSLLIADANNFRVRKVSPAGVITTIAGNGSESNSGDGGSATSASLFAPEGVAVDTAGSVYIVDYYGVIRKVATSGIITTIAGTFGERGTPGDGGPARLAQFSYPCGISIDIGGNIYIADTGDLRIRKIYPNGNIATIAGNGAGGFSGPGGFSGDGGQATNALLNGPSSVAVDPLGNIYISDTNNERVRRISSDGVITTVAGNGSYQSSGDGNQALLAGLEPGPLAIDLSGNLYIADHGRSVRRVSPTGTITTVAGVQYGSSGNGTPATAASFNGIGGIAVDPAGNLYVADEYSYRIRKVTPGGGLITVAGNGTAGSTGDGGPAALAQLQSGALAVDRDGSIYFIDAASGGVRKISPTGIISTVVSGIWGVDFPGVLALDAAGDIYFPTAFGLGLAPKNGAPVAIAGNGGCCYSGDGGPATFARMVPYGIALDNAGRVLIADGSSNAVRALTPATPLSITSTSSLTATANASYFQKLTAAGGFPPYSWAITSGSLPAGLTLSTAGTIQGTVLAAGNFLFTATVGDSFFGSVSQTITLSIPFLSQSISLNPLRAVRVTSSPFTLGATSSSGFPVSFTSGTPSVCTVTGSTVTLVGSGACTVTASQSGSAIYSATSVTQSFDVLQSTPPARLRSEGTDRRN